MKRLTVAALPADPVAAAAAFYRDWVGAAQELLKGGDDVLIAMAPEDYAHRDWRRAAAADLARAHTPRRVVVVAAHGATLDGIAAYLARSPGITGQYLEGAPVGGDGPTAEPA